MLALTLTRTKKKRQVPIYRHIPKGRMKMKSWVDGDVDISLVLSLVVLIVTMLRRGWSGGSVLIGYRSSGNSSDSVGATREEGPPG